MVRESGGETAVLTNAELSGRRSTLLAVTVATCGVLPVFLTGGLAVQIRNDLGFSEAALGLVVSTFFIASALASAIFGRVVEHTGYRVALRVAAGMSAASLLGISVFAHSWGVLVAFMVLGGLANAVGNPAVHLLLARKVPTVRQGLAFGIKQAAIPAASLLGGLAVPLIGTTVGWRWAFAFCAGGALAVAWRIPAMGNDHDDVQGIKEAQAKPHLASLVILALGAGLGSAAAVPLGAFIVQSGVDAGIRVNHAGLLLAAGSAIGLAARVAIGWKADYRVGGHLLVVTAMLVLGAAGFALIATGGAYLLVVGTVLASGAGWGWTGLFNFAVVKNNRGAPAAATGVTQTGAMGGSAVGPAVFGLLVERTSYSTVWTVAAGAAMTAAAAIILGGRILVRHKERGVGISAARDLQCGMKKG